MSKKKFFLTVFVCALIASVCSKKQVEGFSSEGQDTTRLEDLSRLQTSKISFEKARSTLIDKKLTPLLETYLQSFSSTGVSLKAFISYAWPKKQEELGVQGFLLTLVDHLRRAGLHALLDFLELTPGALIEEFMKTGIEESQVVIVVGTDTYYDRTLQETNVRFEFERILGSPQKVIPLLYSGEVTDPFQKHLESSKIKSLFDLRNDRASYYLQLPEIIKHIYQQSSVGLWTEALQRSTDNYLTMCQQILSGITPKTVEESKEALAREAEENEHMIQMQVSLLTQNMPQDERFMPSNWYIPRPTSTFVERKEILDRLKQTLEDSSNPVFLQGPEGIGKKQLALAFAQGCEGQRLCKKYTFGAMVPEGDLTRLQHQLNLPTLEKLSEYLTQTNFLLICPDVSKEHYLQSLLRLPKGHVVITSSSLKPDSKDVTLLRVSGLSVDASVDFLTGLSGIEAEEVWKRIAKKIKYHPGEMEMVALYMRENRIIDPKDIGSYLENMEFYALLERSKEALPLGRQIIAKNLCRQSTLRVSKMKKQEVSLRERVMDHLLRPEIQEFCQQTQKLEHRKDKVLWITSPWDPSQSTLLFMERMEEDLKVCGFTVRYRLDETNTQSHYVFDVMAAQEGSHALLVGTPAFGKDEAKSLTPLLKRFYDTGSLFPLYLEGGWEIFPAEYQKLLIEDISSSSKYAKSLACVVKQILGLKDASFTYLHQTYNQRLDTIEKGLTDAIVSQQGTQIQSQDTERDWQQWMDIKRRAHLLGYEVPPEVWQVMEPDITIGRRDVLSQLLQSFGLVSGNEMKQVVLVGFAGMGKSHLARAYAKDTKNLYTLGAMLNAASTMTLYNDYQKLGEEMGISLPQSSEELMMEMKAALESQKHRGWLLVVDNADTPEEIKPYLPTKGGHLLITSRSQDWGKNSMILLPAIERQDAVALLQARSGLRTEGGAEKLAQALGDHPLALTQAGAYIKENGLQSFEEYVTLLKQKPHLRSAVSATWAVTLEKIQAQSPDGLYILQGLSFLAPENIPHGLLRAWAQKKWKVKGWRLDDRLGRALQVLRQYSMITDTRAEGAGIHRLVQEALREALTLEQTNRYLSELIEVMDQELTQKYKYDDPATWAAVKPFSSHGGMLIAYENTPPEVGQKLIKLSRTLGYLAENLGKYKEQMEYQKRGLEIAEKTYEAAHPEIVTSLYDIGRAYGNLGKYAEQLEVLKKALTIREKTYEADHPKIAISLFKVGFAYGLLSDYAKQLEYLKKALAIFEKTYATDHPEIATLLYAIGGAYGDLGKYAEQLEYLKKALAIFEKTYATDHPEIVTLLYAIGGAYGDLGKYAEQLEVLKKALAIDEKTLAADHPKIATSLYAIGEAYGNLGDYARQLEYLQRGLDIEEKTYATDHPNIANSLYAIGGVYGNLRDYAQQLEYLKKALTIREKTYEADHPKIATSLYAIGLAYGKLGKYAEQLEYLKKALAIFEKTYEADHPEIATWLYAIRRAYGNLGKYAEQLEVLKKALAIEEKTYAADHPKIATSLYAIGGAYGKLGKYAEQLEYLQRALAIWEKTYEADHPSIAMSLYAIGRAYGNLGKYDEQLEVLKKVLAIFEKTYEADHPSIATSLYEIGRAYGNLGDYGQQLAYLQRALAIFEKTYAADHPSIASSLGMIGLAYGNLRDYAQQLEYLKRGLKIQIEKLPADHPNIAASLCLIGEAYGNLGDYAQQLEVLKKTLAIDEKTLAADHPKIAISLFKIGFAYGLLSDYAKQLEYLKKALAIDEKTLAADHPEIATLLYAIGGAYGDLGKYAEQLEVLTKALTIREKTYEADHPSIATSLYAIGLAYGKLGKYAEQLEYLKRALTIREKTYAADHPSIATSLYAIGLAYGKLGKYAEQLEVLKKALAIFEKTYEADHPEIATWLYAIGRAYGNLGKYAEQLEVLKKALAIDEKTLAADHSKIATSLYAIGGAYGKLGKYAEQLEYLQRALAIWEKTLAADHPNIANSLYAIGGVYGNLRDYAQQLEYLKRGLKIQIEKLPADHPNIAASLCLIGEAYGNLGDYAQQLECLQRGLAIEEKTYAADHPDLAITKTAVGEAYKNLRNYGESKRCFEEALRVFEKPYTESRRKVRVLRLYGELHIEMKEMKKALEILKEALALQEEKVSKDHLDTALVLRSLGEAEHAIGEEENATAHLMRALKIQSEKLPAEHLEMVKTKKLMER